MGKEVEFLLFSSFNKNLRNYPFLNKRGSLQDTYLDTIDDSKTIH